MLVECDCGRLYETTVTSHCPETDCTLQKHDATQYRQPKLPASDTRRRAGWFL